MLPVHLTVGHVKFPKYFKGLFTYLCEYLHTSVHKYTPRPEERTSSLGPGAIAVCWTPA